MHIQKLKLHNFKRFEDISIQFHPDLTVIVGENGSEKTSILEGTALALSTVFVKMDGLSGQKIDKGQVHIQRVSDNVGGFL